MLFLWLPPNWNIHHSCPICCVPGYTGCYSVIPHKNKALLVQIICLSFHCSHTCTAVSMVPEEGVQGYGGSYSFVTYSSNIRNEIGVMRFPCNEIAMSDGFEKQNLALTVPKTVHANDLSLEICILLVVKSLHSSRDCWTCSRLGVRTLSSLKLLKMVRFKCL